jgi:hypothetical protein
MLTEIEREWIKELVANVSDATAERIVERVMERVIVSHVASCPYGKKLLKYTFIGIGLAIGAGAAGSSLLTVLLKIVGGAI